MNDIRERRGVRFGFAAAIVLAAALGALAAGPDKTDKPDPPAKMVTIQTPYYTLYTDVNIDLVRETYVRLTAMAEEYNQRTKGFARPIKNRLPVYIFSNDDDYSKAGGMAGSAGVFMGDKLMMRATTGTGLWHVLQHEGFHQFAYSVISPNLPVWLNEGLAEYFGEGIWTGDNMVTGMVPAGRLKRIKSLIEENKMLPFLEMLMMSHETWNRQLDLRNYDQGWSMVHFLVHADGGKYCGPFSDYINDLSKGKSSDAAFTARFGSNVKAFQQRYTDWWKGQDDAGTQDILCRARMETLTSLLGRASWLKMTFDDPKGFFKTCKDGNIVVDGAKAPRLWLPASLVSATLADAPRMGEFKLDNSVPTQPKLILTRGDTVMTGKFTVRADKDGSSCEVTVAAPKAATSKP